MSDLQALPVASISSSRAVALRDPWSMATGPVGNLEAYIRAVNRIPMLTPEEEKSFAEALTKNNDLEAAKRLVLSHLRLVVAIARQYMGYGLAQADLIQEGNIGLMKAVRRFDPDRGVRLVSFAMHWIKAEIHEYVLKNWRMVKIATTKAHRKLFFNLNSFKKHGQTFTPEQIQEVASSLNVKPEEVVEMEARMSGRDVPMELPSDDGDDAFSPIHYLEAEKAEPTDILESRRMETLHSEGLANALNQLDERAKNIISARWLSGDEAKTLHELAAELGISAERVRQIEQQAMKKLRGFMLESA
ncbi:MAG: RNA polymerase sigma factor RpoH [Burkholderiales bacterium]|nr:RNA polymerase sigma factor RpoH [Burkholderiales bacterium]